jgi:hypothetical protein
MNKKNNEWNQIYFADQEAKLILNTTNILENIVDIPYLKSLNSPILISEKHDHYISMGRSESKSITRKIFLTNDGLVEKYFNREHKRFLFIPYNNYIPKDRKISKELFPAIVLTYKISPSKLNNLLEALQF